MSHAPLIVDSTGEELLYSTPLPTHSWNSPQEFLLVPGYQSDATLRYSCNGHILILRCPHIVSSLGTLLDSWPDPNSQFFVTLIYSNQVTNRTRYVYSSRIREHIERSTSIIFCRPFTQFSSALPAASSFFSIFQSSPQRHSLPRASVAFSHNDAAIQYLYTSSIRRLCWSSYLRN